MVRIIAAINLKGGVGKSTIAVNVSACLASHEIPVILIDADPQQTSTIWAENGLLAFKTVANPLRPEIMPATWIDEIRASTDRGVIMIDAPPQLDAATRAILGIADLVLLPVTPSAADLRATLHAVDLIRAARREQKGKPLALLVPNRVDRRTAAGRELVPALAQIGEPIGPALGARSVFVDCCSAGDWVGGYAASSVAAQEISSLTHTIREMLDGNT